MNGEMCGLLVTEGSRLPLWVGSLMCVLLVADGTRGPKWMWGGGGNLL